jgi:hypothetical protein
MSKNCYVLLAPELWGTKVVKTLRNKILRTDHSDWPRKPLYADYGRIVGVAIAMGRE